MDIQKFNNNSALDLINSFSEADFWVNNFNSKQSIETYKFAVGEFIKFLDIK